MLRALLGDDGVGELAIFDREGAAEAAADVAVLELDEPQALDAREQLARLLAHAELAQARAGIVIGRRCRRSAPRPRVTPERIDEEADELAALGGEGDGLRAPRRARRRTARDSVWPACRRRSRSARRRSRSREGARSSGARSPWRRRGRRNCRRAGRSRSATGTTTLQPASSSSFTAAKPTLGRIRSTRQVTNRPTRLPAPGNRFSTSVKIGSPAATARTLDQRRPRFKAGRQIPSPACGRGSG